MLQVASAYLGRGRHGQVGKDVSRLGFGRNSRLTNWPGSVTKRLKYWGKLSAAERVCDYLDPDVAAWPVKTARPRATVKITISG